MAKAGGKFSNLKSISTRFINQSVVFSPALVEKFTSPELAAEMAGTGDKRSKEYKAALRTVQRYRQGTRGAKKPAKVTIEKIERASRAIVGREPAKADVVIGGGTVTVTGWMRYSDDRRLRTVSVDLFSDKMGDLLGFAQQKEFQEVNDIIFDAYGVPGMQFEDFGDARIVLESEE